MSNAGADKAGVSQARVEAHILLLAIRNAAEDQITDAEGKCLPRGEGINILKLLLYKSKIQSGEAPTDFALSFFNQNRANKVSS
jgi:hypothetical protein